MNVEKYQKFLMDTAVRLLTTHSPSGYTDQVAEVLESMVAELGYPTHRTNKGNVVVNVKGREEGKTIGLCAHVDTLGLMVRSITDEGMLMITKIGGPILPTLDGEYCTIPTRDGRSYTGTILSLSPAAHVHDDANTRPREESTMAVRIDEKVSSREDVVALGIEVGNYICFDPKTVVTSSGFLKSRFIDDKGSAACMVTLLKVMKDGDMAPQYDTEFTFTVHEEVGHGGATLPTYTELLVVDMGCIGEDLTCTEHQVSICAKDSSGPFDYEIVSRLIALSKEHGVDYAVDIYPHYNSDAAVAHRAGNDTRCALIGPGVHASHGMERTHWEGMKHTIVLMGHYLGCEKTF